MPPVIGALILAATGGAIADFSVAFSIGSLIFTTSLSSIIGYTVLAVAFIGLSLLLQPPAAPRPQDGQVSLTQQIPFRRRVYGRAKMGGYFMFWDSTGGIFYQVIAIASHQIDAFESFWLGDREVLLDTAGNVVDCIFPPACARLQFNPGGNNRVQIYSNTGAPGKTAYPNMMTAWGDLWDDTYIGIGIADICVQQQSVTEKNFAGVYPGGAQTSRTVLRGAQIVDPRVITSPPTVAWTDNAVCVILDYLTSQDGWRIDPSFFLSGLALAITQDSANVADQAVSLKAGGTEARYRIWGYYDFNEEPRQVLARFLAACAGWLEPQPDGTIAIRVGEWVEPTVTLSDDCILSYQVQRWPGEFDAINQVRAQFVDPMNDYQPMEPDPFEDLADIARRGYVKSTTLDARHCPSFTQTRRIMKVGLAEVNPEWTVNLVTNQFGLAARNQRFVNLVISELSLMISCKVTSFVANVDQGTCAIGLSSFDSSTYDWDPLTEEGSPPPVSQDTSSQYAVDTPADFTAVVEVSVSGGVTQGSYIVMDCTYPTNRQDLTARFELSSDGGANWTVIADGQQTSCKTAILPFGTYQARVSFFAPNKVQGEFAEIDGIIVNADTSAPPEPLNLAALVSSPPLTITIEFTAPNSPNFYAGVVFRSGTDLYSTASPIATVYGAANQNLSYPDTPGSGTWYYWVASINAASPPSLSTPAGSVSGTI